MTSLNNFYVVLAFALSLNLISNTSLSLETFQPSQGPFNSKSLSVYEKYLSDCTSKLKPYCGEQIFFDVFVGNQTMTNHCCLSLLNGMGKASKQKHHKLCSDIAIVQAKTNSNLKWSEKVWNDCSSQLINLLFKMQWMRVSN